MNFTKKPRQIWRHKCSLKFLLSYFVIPTDKEVWIDFTYQKSLQPEKFVILYVLLCGCDTFGPSLAFILSSYFFTCNTPNFGLIIWKVSKFSLCMCGSINLGMMVKQLYYKDSLTHVMIWRRHWLAFFFSNPWKFCFC